MRLETDIGGPGGQFPSTAWSDVLRLADTQDPAYRERLDRLLRIYWKPVYIYIRLSWHQSIEDAKDLTQAFFARMVEKEYLSRIAAERGSFRGYLKVALKHFLLNCRKSKEAHSPDGRAVSLDAAEAELQALERAIPGGSPESAYDDQWRKCLLDASIDALRERLDREGKSVQFQVFRAYCLEPGEIAEESATYEGVAERLGLQRWEVRKSLAYCRQQLLEILRARVRDYVTTDEDLELELKAILGK